MKEFLERFFIAIFLFSTFLTILFFLPPLFIYSVLLFILCVISVEFKYLSQKIGIKISYFFFIAEILVVLFSVGKIPTNILPYLLLSITGISFVFMLILMADKMPSKSLPKSLFVRFLHLFWFTIPILSLIYMVKEGGGRVLVFFVLVLIGVDTFAYLGGKFFGRKKLAPTISPGKTWEGSAIGLLVGILIPILFLQLFPQINFFPFYQVSPFVWVGILLPAILSAMFGDLGESKFKRIIGVKDSSRILGAHGGFLDRFDSYILSAPLFVFLLFFFDLLSVSRFDFPALFFFL